MFKNKQGQIKSGWMIVIAIFFVAIGYVMFLLPTYTLHSLLDLMGGSREGDHLHTMGPWITLLVQGAGAFGGIAATLVVYRSIHKKYPHEIGLLGKPKDIFIGMITGALSVIILFFILYTTGQVNVQSGLGKPQFSSYTIALFLLFFLLALFAEIFFRGYLMKMMKEGRQQTKTIYITTAALFAALHAITLHFHLLGLVNVFLMGLLFAYMFDRTRSLLLSIGFHFMWMYVQGSIFGFPISGINAHGLYILDVTNGIGLLTGGSFGLTGSILTTIWIGLLFFFTQKYTEKTVIQKVQ